MGREGGKEVQTNSGMPIAHNTTRSHMYSHFSGYSIPSALCLISVDRGCQQEGEEGQGSRHSLDRRCSDFTSHEPLNSRKNGMVDSPQGRETV